MGAVREVKTEHRASKIGLKIKYRQHFFAVWMILDDALPICDCSHAAEMLEKLHIHTTKKLSVDFFYFLG